MRDEKMSTEPSICMPFLASKSPSHMVHDICMPFVCHLFVLMLWAPGSNARTLISKLLCNLVLKLLGAGRGEIIF